MVADLFHDVFSPGGPKTKQINTTKWQFVVFSPLRLAPHDRCMGKTRHI